MASVELLRPKLNGRRFDGGEIPLEVLSDLAALQEMVFEVAKWRFKQDNPNRRRVPNGFTSRVHLKLISLENGSATPVIGLSEKQPDFRSSLNVPYQRYFDEAIEHIINAVDIVDESDRRTSNRDFPREFLSYFDKFGHSLQDEEFIELSTPSGKFSSWVDKEKCQKLLDISRRRELNREYSLRGSVSEVDQSKMTFEFQPVYGSKVTAPIPEQHRESILETFNGYREGQRVLVQGVGLYDQQNRLLRLESIEHITMLDPLDVPARLDEFRDMRNGWLNGEGTAPTQAGLDWLVESFESYFPPYAPLPYTYPTPWGGVQMEWSLGTDEVSLDINIDEYFAEWHCLNITSRESDTRILHLWSADDWSWLSEQLIAKARLD